MNIDSLFNRIAWNATIQQATVSKRLFKTSSGTWTEDETQADYQRWHNLPSGMMCCDVRYEKYYIVVGKRYEDIIEAKNAMYDELFVKPCVLPLLNEIIKFIKTQEQKEKRFLKQFMNRRDCDTNL